MSERDVLFISHATPDDNEFVRWLGTRLTGYGYKVWADIFDLAGGTPFWISIEDAIRKKALKVVFVVSKASCHPDRTGVRNEISVADAVRKSLKDPEFISEAAKMQLEIEPLTGDQIDKLLVKAYGSPKAIVQRAVELLEPSGRR